MNKNVAYLCDGKACGKMCAETMTPEQWKKYECHHTFDESHARNKCRRKRKIVYSNGKGIEKE